MTPSERDLIEHSHEEVDQVRRAIEKARSDAQLATLRQMLRRIVAARGEALTEAQSQRIDGCDDVKVLDKSRTGLAD